MSKLPPLVVREMQALKCCSKSSHQVDEGIQTARSAGYRGAIIVLLNPERGAQNEIAASFNHGKVCLHVHAQRGAEETWAGERVQPCTLQMAKSYQQERAESFYLHKYVLCKRQDLCLSCSS